MIFKSRLDIKVNVSKKIARNACAAALGLKDDLVVTSGVLTQTQTLLVKHKSKKHH